MNMAEITRIADMIKRHPTTVFRWLNRTRKISPEDATALQEATGVDRMAWLYPDEFKNPYMDKKTNSPTASPGDSRNGA